MSLSMYQASVPAFLQTLNNLSAILEKPRPMPEPKIDPEVLLNYRLAPDMLRSFARPDCGRSGGAAGGSEKRGGAREDKGSAPQQGGGLPGRFKAAPVPPGGSGV